MVESKQSEQKDFFKVLKSKKKGFLIQLTEEERQRVADYILTEYELEKSHHEKRCEKFRYWDGVSRLQREEMQGSDGNLPNYRMPLTLTAHEVIHANIMNVFFSPSDLIRALPTEENDIAKMESVERFGNWSVKNELNIEENCDRLFRLTAKIGENPYMVYWCKEWGVRIRREIKKDEAGNDIVDSITQEPEFWEIEEPYLKYNAPIMEVLNREDYLFPHDTAMNDLPAWEARLCRISYDVFLKGELQGLYYSGSVQDIKDWPMSQSLQVSKQTGDGDEIQTGKWKGEFIEWYGKMRVESVKDRLDDKETMEFEELEDEMIALVNIKSRQLCQLRKNKFPSKQRPFGMDYFIADDNGLRQGIGIYELMDSPQKAYDALFNQFVNAVDLANQPLVFFTPTGNLRDEPLKLQRGFAYPTSDSNSVKLFQFPGPTESLMMAMELVQQWAQLLFGISDYAAGMESSIDPSAPAKKVEIVVQQGNVRLNMIIKRKIRTLQDILSRWFMLYKENMPANKFMRIAGGTGEDPFKFNKIAPEDFALQGTPDFELTGNILNANKQLELNKAVATYQLLIVSPLFNPQTREGLMAQSSLVKWLLSKVDDIGLLHALPQFKLDGQVIHTPEEENAYMLQGEEVEPIEQEDQMRHLKVHQEFINNPNIPDEVKKIVAEHIQKTLMLVRQLMAKQMQMQMMAQQIAQRQAVVQGGGNGGFNQGANNRIAAVDAGGQGSVGEGAAGTGGGFTL